MAERSPIFSTKGEQIGYVQGNAAFDLFDRHRCGYDAATGNLSDSNNWKTYCLRIVGQKFRCAIADCGRAIWATW